MSWTYSGNPSNSARDEIRFLVGDTDTTDQQVTDEEIAYAAANEANNQLAAARIARALAAKYSRKADKSVGDLSISYSQMAKSFWDLATKLESSGSISGAAPYAGGISISDKQTVQDNTDRFVPSFKKGKFDYNENSVNNTFDDINR